jgi:hypothetical protein
MKTGSSSLVRSIPAAECVIAALHPYDRIDAGVELLAALEYLDADDILLKLGRAPVERGAHQERQKLT